MRPAGDGHQRCRPSNASCRKPTADAKELAQQQLAWPTVPSRISMMRFAFSSTTPAAHELALHDQRG